MGRLKSKLPPGLQFTGGKFIVDKIVNGERIKKRLSVTSADDAIREYSALVCDTERGIRVKYSANSLTVDSVLEHYYNNHLKYIKSGRDAKYHIPTISKLIGRRKVLDLKKSDIERYKNTRCNSTTSYGTAISARTLQAELQHLNMAITRAVDDELLPRNPVLRFCKVSVPRKPIILLDDGYDHGGEWKALYEQVPEKWKLFCLIGYEAGLRPSEVEHFKCDWVTNIGTSYMIIIPGECEKTKNHFRRIPVSKSLEPCLLNAIYGKSGQLFTSVDYNKMIKTAVKKSGINPNIRMKSLRKTRLTIWDGIDSGAARVAGGHVPIDVHEESYARVNDARLFRLVNIECEKLKIYKTG